jgi:aminopeptidase N
VWVVLAQPDALAEPGVALTTARARSTALRGIHYRIELDIPASVQQRVTGRSQIRFTIDAPRDLIVDFVAADVVRTAGVNGREASISIAAEHLLIPAAYLRQGENEAEFEFACGDQALHRQPDCLYSLFVPAKARYAFPCFDQPDLKAAFTLVLNIPSGWSAVSNAPLDRAEAGAGQTRLEFRETEAIPTYLFAFAAGVFHVEQGVRAGRRLEVWHREQDLGSVQRNLDAILDLHGDALSWLEGYTDVQYPFSQFSIVLLPSFQFSGMEHPGAIFYNAERLLLPASASEHDYVRRTALIAHETAHIWFGDLVTMRWFDDVWVKEVFANFMAEKIVAERYPQQDHQLRFFLANYPSAYAVDRSAGSNPIRQPLENLVDAGRLYGPIIYLKAPIVFRQLERQIGPHTFRDAVRRFLRDYRFSNASWAELLPYFEAGGLYSLRQWSDAWISEAGRPMVTAEWQVDPVTPAVDVSLRATDPSGNNRTWPQQLEVAIGYRDHVTTQLVELHEFTRLSSTQAQAPDFVLAGGGGVGYGEFPLDPASREWLVAQVESIPDRLTRGVAWVTLWDELLEGRVLAVDLMEAARRTLERERDRQIIDLVLGIAARAFWMFLSASERETAAPVLETCLARRLQQSDDPRESAAWFSALREVTLTPAGCLWLEAVWARTAPAGSLELGESDEIALACELAVRSVAGWFEILEAQQRRIEDPERLARFSFLRPALAADEPERHEAFSRLHDPRWRTREPWVLTSLQYLNHPLRQAHARRFIQPGLELLPQIARTGDIFFPSRWAETLLSGHSSPAAALIVDGCLAEAHLAGRLRNVVLIAADVLFRAARIRRRPAPGR